MAPIPNPWAFILPDTGRPLAKGLPSTAEMANPLGKQSLGDQASDTGRQDVETIDSNLKSPTRDMKAETKTKLRIIGKRLAESSQQSTNVAETPRKKLKLKLNFSRALVNPKFAAQESTDPYEILVAFSEVNWNPPPRPIKHQGSFRQIEIDPHHDEHGCLLVPIDLTETSMKAPDPVHKLTRMAYKHQGKLLANGEKPCEVPEIEIKGRQNLSRTIKITCDQYAATEQYWSELLKQFCHFKIESFEKWVEWKDTEDCHFVEIEFATIEQSKFAYNVLKQYGTRSQWGVIGFVPLNGVHSRTPSSSSLST